MGFVGACVSDPAANPPEMLGAIDRADAAGAQIVLADREIRGTLLRTWRKMGFWNKVSPPLPIARGHSPLASAFRFAIRSPADLITSPG